MSISFDTPSGVKIARDDVDVPDDPSEIFAELVADASRCCQQCYRRLRSRRRFPDLAGYDHSDLMSYVDTVLPSGSRFELLGTEYWESQEEFGRVDRVHPPGETPAESRGACRFCAAIEPHRSPSTRSREAALEAATGISATLTEHFIPHNPLVLLVEVADLKQEPDYAGDDFETLSLATERAIRAAGGC